MLDLFEMNMIIRMIVQLCKLALKLMAIAIPASLWVFCPPAGAFVTLLMLSKVHGQDQSLGAVPAARNEIRCNKSAALCIGGAMILCLGMGIAVLGAMITKREMSEDLIFFENIIPAAMGFWDLRLYRRLNK